MTVALCGDLWIYPESFRCSGLLIWPVYVNFDLDESESGEYAKQAAMACGKALLVNPLSKEPISRGEPFSLRTVKSNRASVLIKKGIGRRSITQSFRFIVIRRIIRWTKPS